MCGIKLPVSVLVCPALFISAGAGEPQATTRKTATGSGKGLLPARIPGVLRR